MSDTTLAEVSVPALSNERGRADKKDNIRWYSWLGGSIGTAIIIAAMVSSQDFPVLPH